MLWSGGAFAVSPQCVSGDYILAVDEFKGFTGKRMMQWRVKEGETFLWRFTHSITLTPVESRYRVEKGEIIQTMEVFETHGYGLPSNTDDIGVKEWQTKDGKYFLSMKRRVSPLIFRISTEYKSRLYVKGSEYLLKNYDGKALKVSVMCDM